jgi:two-component system NarL family sensor kinase
MPPDFSRLSLNLSIFDMCNKFAARTNIECVCSINEQVDFSSLQAEKQLHLFRMIQESFNNIEKHSQANKAILTARNTKDGGILICVSDDGIGFSSAQKDHQDVATPGVSTPGLGLKSMQQRAAIIGAKLDFQSESGHGLIVRIVLP